VCGAGELCGSEQLGGLVQFTLLQQQVLLYDAVSQLTQLLIAEHLLQQGLEHLHNTPGLLTPAQHTWTVNTCTTHLDGEHLHNTPGG